MVNNFLTTRARNTRNWELTHELVDHLLSLHSVYSVLSMVKISRLILDFFLFAL